MCFNFDLQKYKSICIQYKNPNISSYFDYQVHRDTISYTRIYTAYFIDSDSIDLFSLQTRP